MLHRHKLLSKTGTTAKTYGVIMPRAPTKKSKRRILTVNKIMRSSRNWSNWPRMSPTDMEAKCTKEVESKGESEVEIFRGKSNSLLLTKSFLYSRVVSPSSSLIFVDFLDTPSFSIFYNTVFLYPSVLILN